VIKAFFELVLGILFRLLVLRLLWLRSKT